MNIKLEINKELRKSIDSAIIAATNIGASVEIEIYTDCKDKATYNNKIVIRFIK